jgi:hypothetical protein
MYSPNLPGHDGNPPVIDELRDYAGKGKRESVRMNRYDTVGWLRQRGLVEKHHEEAARRLQIDAEDATIGRFTASGTGGKASSAFRLSDAKLDAMERHADARAALRKAFDKLGTEAEYLITIVVIDGHTLTNAAAIMKTNRNGVLLALRHGLGTLARHYRLA